MISDPLQHLLEKLNRGDPDAAQEVFLTYEPYLRMVVRRQLSAGLRAKFDSIDIVQSVWVDVLEGFRRADWSFHDADHLRAFLVRVTRNRFIDRVRQHRGALLRERPLSPLESDEVPSPMDSRPSQVVQADDLWQQMLDLCTPEHQQVLRLKKQGLPLAEIAARTGLHPGSVRRILYDVARRLGEAVGSRQ